MTEPYINTTATNYLDYNAKYTSEELQKICLGQLTNENYEKCNDEIQKYEKCINEGKNDCDETKIKKCYETSLCKNIELKQQNNNYLQTENGRTQASTDLGGMLRQNTYKCFFYGFSILLISYNIIYNA